MMGFFRYVIVFFIFVMIGMVGGEYFLVVVILLMRGIVRILFNDFGIFFNMIKLIWLEYFGFYLFIYNWFCRGVIVVGFFEEVRIK